MMQAVAELLAIDGGAEGGSTSDEREGELASNGMQAGALTSGGVAGVGASSCALGPWLGEHSACSALAVGATVITGSTKWTTGFAVVRAIKGGKTGRMGLADTVTEGGRVRGTGRTGPADAMMEGEMVGVTAGGASGLCPDGPALETCLAGEGAVWTRVGAKSAKRLVVGAMPICMEGCTQGVITDGCLDGPAMGAATEGGIWPRVTGCLDGPAMGAATERGIWPRVTGCIDGPAAMKGVIWPRVGIARVVRCAVEGPVGVTPAEVRATERRRVSSGPSRVRRKL
jgi:hypothetical protein